MEQARHLRLGEVATGTANYTGQHRFGQYGYHPGDRDRYIELDDALEERVSLDKYSKFKNLTD